MCRLNHHRASFNKPIATFTFQSTTQCVQHRWQTASFAFQWESKLDRVKTVIWRKIYLQGFPTHWPSVDRVGRKNRGLNCKTSLNLHVHKYIYTYTITITQLQLHKYKDTILLTRSRIVKLH